MLCLLLIWFGILQSDWFRFFNLPGRGCGLSFLLSYKSWNASLHEGQSDASLDSLFIHACGWDYAWCSIRSCYFYQRELISEDFLAFSYLLNLYILNHRFYGLYKSHSNYRIPCTHIPVHCTNSNFDFRSRRDITCCFLGAVFVRLGNFINLEIIGKPTATSRTFKQLGEDFL
jgi:hypothetical protein